MSKAAMNLQDSFLNQVRRENSEVRVLLVNGTLLRGIVKGFDNFTLILNNRNGQHLVYKHAIAQIVSHRPHVKAEDMVSDDEGAKDINADGSVPDAEVSTEAGTESSPAAERGTRRDAQPRPPRKERSPRPREFTTRDKEQSAPQHERSGEAGQTPREAAAPKSQPAKGNKDRPKKEGFNTLDLSSVKLGDK